VLGELLAGELRAAGLEDVSIDDNGYVTAALDATVDRDAQMPMVGLLAHLDTSPDAPGNGVEPIVHRSYDGAIIELPKGGTRLDPASMPELVGKSGHDLVTASGDTLLGADDKAGIAAIVTAVAHLAAHPELPRPPLRVAFTPDEEIGAGARLLDLDRFGATCAYTVDGSEVGELQDETFSALEAIVTITGVDVHPGWAKGRMVNALRLAARVVSALPVDNLAPEATDGRDGYIHPYVISGSPARAEIHLILRDFDDDLLDSHAALLERTAHQIVDAEPRAGLEIRLREQYRNMRRHVEPLPRLVEVAAEAMRMEGIEPIRTAIRGGTDGSQLSARGLPTPNIFDGGHEYHSVREWVSLQDMAAAAATLVHMAALWSEPAAQ